MKATHHGKKKALAPTNERMLHAWAGPGDGVREPTADHCQLATETCGRIPDDLKAESAVRWATTDTIRRVICT